MSATKTAIPTPILHLFGMLKQNEDSDGGWNGGDTVEILCDWFEKHGLTPEPKVAGRQVCPVCDRRFTEDDEDDNDDAAERLGDHIIAKHTPERP